MDQEQRMDQLFSAMEEELNHRQPNLERLTNAYQQIIREARTLNLASDVVNSLRQQLILRLLEYGLHLKGMWQSNDQMAEQYFKRALTIERRLPLAHYRLGHQACKKRKWGEVVYHFTKALEQTASSDCWQQVRLDEVQSLTAQKWVSFCSWQLLKTYGTSKSLNHQAYPELDQSLEDFLYLIEQEGAFKKIDSQGNVALLSYEDYEDLLDEPDLLIIDRIANQAQLHYQGRSFELTILQVNLLIALFKSDVEELEWDVFPIAFSERSIDTNRKFVRRLSQLCCDHFQLTPSEFGLNYQLKEGRQIASFTPKPTCIYITRRNE